jgi:hypothetical protein
MVFRRGGVVMQRESWYLNSVNIEVVSYYRYLWLIFSSFLLWDRAKLTLSQQADKSMGMILAFVNKTNLSYAKKLYLFDRMIIPILTYESEIWGYEYSEVTEKIHAQFCKKMLKVPT